LSEEIAVDYRVVCASIACILIVGMTMTDFVSAGEPYPVPSRLNVGPLVDELEYRVIPFQDDRVLAIQAGEIEMDTSFFDPVHLPTLSDWIDVDIYSALRNGYGHITINCAKYPLNISGFRRAFAYAFDKTRVTVEIMNGFSQEHDSLVPYVSGWCIEDNLPYHYYTAQPEIGNEILDNRGFVIDPDTGWRNAPDGSTLHVVIAYASSSPEIAGGIARIAADALHSLYVDAEAVAYGFDEYSRLRPDFDMVFYATDFNSLDVEWLAYEYWSDRQFSVNDYDHEFRNDTFDAWRDQLLHSTTYEGVYEASANMQMILHENVPRLVVYENTYMQTYRNDIYEGHVRDLCRYITGPWTMRKVHRISGEGGSVPIAVAQEPDSFNIFVAQSPPSQSILDNLYSSLFRRDPNQHPVMDLAKGIEIRTHQEDASIPDGHTRFILEIVTNATWSDGTPLTAQDVAFTFTYILESSHYGNPAAIPLTDLSQAVAIDSHTVRLDFITESYWHFENFAYVKIIPKHVFDDTGEIGYQGWNLWNPVFDADEPHVTCGPYVFSDYEPGEFYRLGKNPLYHYHPRSIPAQTPGVVEPTIEVQGGSTGVFIVWVSSSNHSLGGTYVLREGTTILAQGSWSGGSLQIDVSVLPPGEHELTLDITYLDGHEESSQVIVAVQSSDHGWISSIENLPLAMGVAVISAQVIVAVVILSIRDYRRWKNWNLQRRQEDERDWFAEIFGTGPGE
jgi:ABC-type transport system substrate-binding protein